MVANLCPLCLWPTAPERGGKQPSRPPSGPPGRKPLIPAGAAGQGPSLRGRGETGTAPRKSAPSACRATRGISWDCSGRPEKGVHGSTPVRQPRPSRRPRAGRPPLPKPTGLRRPRPSRKGRSGPSRSPSGPPHFGRLWPDSPKGKCQAERPRLPIPIQTPAGHFPPPPTHSGGGEAELPRRPLRPGHISRRGSANKGTKGRLSPLRSPARPSARAGQLLQPPGTRPRPRRPSPALTRSGPARDGARRRQPAESERPRQPPALPPEGGASERGGGAAAATRVCVWGAGFGARGAAPPSRLGAPEGARGGARDSGPASRACVARTGRDLRRKREPWRRSRRRPSRGSGSTSSGARWAPGLRGGGGAAGPVSHPPSA